MLKSGRKRWKRRRRITVGDSKYIYDKYIIMIMIIKLKLNG